MTKFTPKNLNSGFNDTDSLNENFSQLATLSDTWLSRDGTAPNSMAADLDMAGYLLLNIGGFTFDGFTIPSDLVTYDDTDNIYAVGATVQVALDSVEQSFIAMDARIVALETAPSIGDNTINIYDGASPTPLADRVLLLSSGSDGTLVESLPLSTEDIYLAVRHQNNSTAPNALVQLDASGQIPLSLLPVDGITIVGLWDPVVDGPVPPPNGSSEQGNVYIFSAAGDMTILTGDNQTPHTVAVDVNDSMIFIVSGGTVVEGWYFLEQTDQTSLPASSITFDNTGTGFVGSDVQSVLEEADTSITGKVAKTGDTMTGNLTVSRFGQAVDARLTALSDAGGASLLISRNDGSYNLKQLSSGGALEKDWVKCYRDSGPIFYYNGDPVARTVVEGFQVYSGTTDSSVAIGEIALSTVPRLLLRRDGGGCALTVGPAGDLGMYLSDPDGLTNPVAGFSIKKAGQVELNYLGEVRIGTTSSGAKIGEFVLGESAKVVVGNPLASDTSSIVAASALGSARLHVTADGIGTVGLASPTGDTSNYPALVMFLDGTVDLTHDGSSKISTTPTGVEVIGDLSKRTEGGFTHHELPANSSGKIFITSTPPTAGQGSPGQIWFVV